MDCLCNFKAALSSGKIVHVFGLLVVCQRWELASHYYSYFYTVRGRSYSDKDVLLSLEKVDNTQTFDTPEEAYKFIDKIVEKYPRYGDDRDFDMELAPLYEGVEI